jgi:N-acetylmuramoyl-L-alanine amidase
VETAKAVPPATPTADAPKTAQPIPGGAHSLTRALGLKIGRILLDPGHGGHDTGTIGPGGYTEKELVLDIAQRLGKLIEERLGSEVVYTRTEDASVSLEERAAMANQMQADLFLSIHANSSRTRAAAGIETYYLNFTDDPEALAVAARENAGAQETISELQGMVRKIAMQEKLDESKQFATRVHAALKKALAKGQPAKFDRGVKKAPFVVLIGAQMPAVLAEISFLSNPQEEKRLKTSEHRQKIAEALFAGIANYAETMSGVRVAQAASAVPTRAVSASLE